MRHAIVSDIHGNIDALEAVLADVRSQAADDMVCLGDFVGYGAAPNECIERLRPLIQHAVAGNHDWAACGRIKLGYFNPDAAAAARWTTEKLTEAHLTYLRELPMAVSWQGLHLVHATPIEPEEWHYVFSPADAAYEMQQVAEQVCLIGHSHYPGTFELAGTSVQYTRQEQVRGDRDCRYLINVGSVGQPRDSDPRAAWLLIDDEKFTFEHRRVEYDIPAAMQRIREAGLPPYLADRLQWGE